VKLGDENEPGTHRLSPHSARLEGCLLRDHAIRHDLRALERIRSRVEGDKRMGKSRNPTRAMSIIGSKLPIEGTSDASLQIASVSSDRSAKRWPKRSLHKGGPEGVVTVAREDTDILFIVGLQ
jgi:hypothetical protein